MIVAIVSRIQVATFTGDEFKALPRIEQIRAKLGKFEKVEEVVISRVAVENAEELRNWILQICDKIQEGVIVYVDAFKDRFLFNEGYDESVKAGMTEGIIYQETRMGSTAPRGEHDRSKGMVFFGTDKVMQSPAGLDPSSSIICRVIGRNLAEFQRTYEYLYKLSNTSKLQLLNSTLLGSILTMTNTIHEVQRPAVTNSELKTRVKEFEAKYPQGMSESEIEQTVISSLQGGEDEYRAAMRKSLEAQYKENPKAFCENSKKFDIEAVIRDMRIKSGWIPTDRPQPLRITEVVNRHHLRILKEEIDRLCQQGNESPQN